MKFILNLKKILLLLSYGILDICDKFLNNMLTYTSIIYFYLAWKLRIKLNKATAREDTRLGRIFFSKNPPRLKFLY